MPVIELDAVVWGLGGRGLLRTGRIEGVYWAGDKPYTTVVGKDVVTPSRLRVEIVNGVQQAELFALPTDGSSCVRWQITENGVVLYGPIYTTVPDVESVVFGDLPRVDPETFAPVDMTPTIQDVLTEAQGAVTVATSAAGEATDASAVAVAAAASVIPSTDAALVAVLGDPTSQAAIQQKATIGEVAFAAQPIVVDGSRPVHSDLVQQAVRKTFGSGFGSSTMNALAGTELVSLCGSLGISLYNGGVSGERLEWLEARVGSLRPLLAFPSDEVPASGSVTVTAVGSWRRSVGTNNAIPGRVAGVPGSLTWVTDHLVWTRTTAGTAVALSGPVEHVADEGENRRADVLFLNIGKNTIGEADADARIITAIRRVMAWAGAVQKRVVVIGHYCDTNTAASSLERTQIRAVNEWCRQTFGPYFVDLYGYVTGSQAWTDTGITPNSTTDPAQQALGNLPPSLANPGDNQHMNPATRKAVCDRLIAPVLALYGYVAPSFTQVAADSFNRADAGTLGSTDSGGLAWTTKRGTVAVVSNAATATATGTGALAAATVIVPGGAQDYRARATIKDANCGLIVRATGASGYLMYFVSGSGWRMFRATSGGALTPLGGVGLPTTFVAGVEIAIVCNGGQIIPYVGGVAGAPIVDATFAGLEAGLVWRTDLNRAIEAWGLDMPT